MQLCTVQQSILLCLRFAQYSIVENWHNALLLNGGDLRYALSYTHTVLYYFILSTFWRVHVHLVRSRCTFCSFPFFFTVYLLSRFWSPLLSSNAFIRSHILHLISTLSRISSFANQRGQYDLYAPWAYLRDPPNNTSPNVSCFHFLFKLTIICVIRRLWRRKSQYCTGILH